MKTRTYLGKPLHKKSILANAIGNVRYGAAPVGGYGNPDTLTLQK